MHSNSRSHSYAAAGVDITAGYRAVELMKKHIARTRSEGCLDDVGGFGGCFGLPMAGMEEPVLVSGTDGVGTKLKLAILTDKHDTIGVDCVAMCVNDIICCGARPLFFLDYIACGKNVPEKIAAIVSGVAEGCVQSGAALIGGETAEHPGLMAKDDYDLAGYCTGIADRKKMLDKSTVQEGDAIIDFLAMLHADKVIIGDIMLLIPGMMLTNSIGDILLGDVISGSIRLIEAVMLAASLALGIMAAIILMQGVIF